MWNGLVGTYSERDSQGIYSVSLDETTGMLENVQLFAPLENSKYLARQGDRLISLCSEGGRGGVALLNGAGKLLSKCLFEEGIPCYVLAEGDFLYCSNYHLGTVSLLRCVGEEISLVKQQSIAVKAGAHQVISYKNLCFVPCLHLDTMKIFSKDLEPQGEIRFPTGAGCRHGVLSLNQEFLYVLGELSNEIYCISLETREILSSMSILPPNVESKEGGSALRLSEDGKRLYASTRGEVNGIALVDIQGRDMTLGGFFSSEGCHPRDILNICQDKFLLVANQHSDSLVVFDCEKNFAKICEVAVPEGVAILERMNET